MMVKDRQTPNLRWPKIDVLKIISGYDELRVCWRADRIRQLRRRTLDEIPTPPGTPRRPQHPNKAPQVTYLSGVLEADLEAAD